MNRRNRPMPRAERRKQLLEIAGDIVRTDGIGALTMIALSEKAGVAKPAMRAREGLVRTLFNHDDFVTLR